MGYNWSMDIPETPTRETVNIYYAPDSNSATCAIKTTDGGSTGVRVNPGLSLLLWAFIREPFKKPVVGDPSNSLVQRLAGENAEKILVRESHGLGDYQLNIIQGDFPVNESNKIHEIDYDRYFIGILGNTINDGLSLLGEGLDDLGESIKQEIVIPVKNLLKEHWRIPLYAVAGLALGVVIKEFAEAISYTAESKKILPIGLRATLFGLSYSTFLNIAEYKVYKKLPANPLLTWGIDSVKYIAFAGLVIGGSNQLQDMLGINYNESLSNNAFVKIWRNLTSFLTPAQAGAFGISMGAQYFESLTSGKFKSPKTGVKLLLELFDALPFATAVLLFPQLVFLNIYSAGKLALDVYRRNKDEEFSKKQKKK